MSSTIFYIELKEHCVLGVKKLISRIRILECYRKIVNMQSTGDLVNLGATKSEQSNKTFSLSYSFLNHSFAQVCLMDVVREACTL